MQWSTRSCVMWMWKLEMLQQQPKYCYMTVLRMSLKKVTLLGSNLASVTDLKRIETPHSLCCDFRGYKTFTTCWSGYQVQVWVQVWAPAGHLAISQKIASQKITPCQPCGPSLTSPRPPCPCSLTPLCPTQTLSATLVWSPNVSNQ